MLGCENPFGLGAARYAVRPKRGGRGLMAQAALRGVDVDGARAAAFDPDALRRAFRLLERWVEAGVLPGAAALVARGGRIAGEAYAGLAHRAERRPADSETVWSLASVTKPFT